MPVTNYCCVRVGAMLFVGLLFFLSAMRPLAAELPETIRAIKPSVVGVGSYSKTRSPPLVFFGTGFAVGDGLTIVTNAHVVPAVFDETRKENLLVLIGRGSDYEQREARVLVSDRGRDLALLRIDGPPLPALKIGDSLLAREGQSLAFTGYPLAMALGLHAATHRATLAAITPIVGPPPNVRQLNAATVARVREGPFTIFQLDGTAYPGNSGSPLYDVETGDVLGIINMVFVKSTKETAITNPSGISYAIPSQYIKALLERR
ncbi:MAG: trypsin-like peptidase domain-containing protein [Burkholderiales bacterium]|nr:trypsin-like peptidase domain-containing protein [Burkholderiales bacterium]